MPKITIDAVKDFISRTADFTRNLFSESTVEKAAAKVTQIRRSIISDERLEELIIRGEEFRDTLYAETELRTSAFMRTPFGTLLLRIAAVFRIIVRRLRIVSADYGALVVVLFHCLALAACRPFVVLHAQACGANEMQIALVIALFHLVQVICVLASGRILDKWGASDPSTASSLAFALGALLFYLSTDVRLDIFAAMLMGFAQGLLLPTSEALMTGRDNIRHRVSGLGLLTAFNAAGTFAGPALGGWMYTYWGKENVFLGIAALGLVPLLISFLLPDRPDGNFQRTEFSIDSLGLLRNRALINNLMLTGCVLAILDLTFTYIPMYCMSIWLTPIEIGYMLSAKGLAQMLVLILTDFLGIRFGRGVLFLAALLAGTAAAVLVPFTESFWMILAMCALMGAALGLANLALTSQGDDLATNRTYNQMLTLRMAFGLLAQSVAPILFGLAQMIGGLPPVFWLCGVMSLTCAFFFLRKGSKPRRRPT